MLQETYGCTHPFEVVFWVPLNTYPEVRLLSPSLCLVIALILKSTLSGISISTLVVAVVVVVVVVVVFPSNKGASIRLPDDFSTE